MSRRRCLRPPHPSSSGTRPPGTDCPGAFDERGFQSVNTDDIAQVVCAGPTLHRHFPSKAELPVAAASPAANSDVRT
ncbi:MULTISPECIES: TetR/AcrR family transcriptional regulator [unclassified Streptomyces]|uniref:TetR/AcrR family transcriptional regulator n=1 Tax=unclassified Streptomyces TaxID=2593676 RepID=UPI0037AB395B